MLKYVDSAVVFQEIPDETTLAITLSGCPCRCPGCHSPYLWRDEGKPLDCHALDQMVEAENRNITCVCFMGGDAEPKEVSRLADHLRHHYPNLHLAWYTGRTLVSSHVDRQLFDYVKVGPYIAHLGPLTSKHTNQRLFHRHHDNSWHDITYRFWK